MMKVYCGRRHSWQWWNSGYHKTRRVNWALGLKPVTPSRTCTCTEVGVNSWLGCRSISSFACWLGRHTCISPSHRQTSHCWSFMNHAPRCFDHRNPIQYLVVHFPRKPPKTSEFSSSLSSLCHYWSSLYFLSCCCLHASNNSLSVTLYEWIIYI